MVTCPHQVILVVTGGGDLSPPGDFGGEGDDFGGDFGGEGGDLSPPGDFGGDRWW